MRYAVLLQRRPDGKFQAVVPLLPDITRVGETRDEALEAVQLAIVDALETTELVYLDVPSAQLTTGNPWLDTAGIFADDPELEPMLHDIYAARESE
jgi:predicted RNase H-like HicB family nuclease